MSRTERPELLASGDGAEAWRLPDGSYEVRLPNARWVFPVRLGATQVAGDRPKEPSR